MPTEPGWTTAMAQSESSLLWGFERDLHELLDDFLVQVVEGGLAPSLDTFKALWESGCISFIHQAYPGCERSPDYVQLLYATVLDRLDHPSPLPRPPLVAVDGLGGGGAMVVSSGGGGPSGGGGG
ncbi:MAG: hypothetical protein J3K34DRAFT_444819, partial [Monoraphidium minutum]